MIRNNRFWPVRLLALVVAGAASAGFLPAAVTEPNSEIVVRADVARIEIERILSADNLDTGRLNPREVADRMAAIRRGRAPEDFWLAYQRHVDAWQSLADAAENGFRADSSELIAAETWINRSFDEVERIARRYGARLPQPFATMSATR